ncbi:hypothetical protein F4561_001181 [Lipingzhangella halophila]|uniref:DUF4279 domain-containing protein n=1 Tax=Lipingzhangella halophila TaxID=1783352 RepID=A0A7W7W176_9ACTN|nr:hypothetical protein [Lipingzhangella halophila]MBB4930361.1 hypothetical protein [Lipingzhangella halophila]
MSEPPFRLSVGLGVTLDEGHVRDLRAALAESGNDSLLVERHTRRGVSWRIDLGEAQRPDELFRRLAVLGEGVARVIAGIVRAQTGGAPAGPYEAWVVLSLCQKIDEPDDPRQSGISIDEDVVAWAALAGAAIDIDQYVYVD